MKIANSLSTTADTLLGNVEVAHPKNPDLDLITMQFLVKAAELGTPSLVPKHTVYMQLLNSNTRDYVGGS
jgi:hypothetical protein